MRFINNKSAFTLIELIVVIAIIGTVTVVTIVNFKQGKKNEALRLEAQLLATRLREMQNKAITDVKDITDHNHVNGYGITFKGGENENNKYHLCADIVGDGRCTDPDDFNAMADSEKILTNDIIIYSIDQALDGWSDVIFKDDGTILINGFGSTEILGLTITLKNTVTEMTKDVVINSLSGQIGVQD